MAYNKLRVGIIGAGEVAQVIHLPALAMLNHLYTVTAICDISQKVNTESSFQPPIYNSQTNDRPKNITHCAQKFHIPFATTSATEVIESPDVDVVFNLTSDEYHEPYTGKNIGIALPLSRRMLTQPQYVSLPLLLRGGKKKEKKSKQHRAPSTAQSHPKSRSNNLAN